MPPAKQSDFGVYRGQDRLAAVRELMTLPVPCPQQWFGLNDPAMKKALFDVSLYREVSGTESGLVRLLDGSMIQRFYRLLHNWLRGSLQPSTQCLIAG